MAIRVVTNSCTLCSLGGWSFYCIFKNLPTLCCFQTASQESPLPVSGCSTHTLWCMLNSLILFRAPCKACYLAPVLKTEMFAKLDLKGFCGATYLKGGMKTLVTKWHSLQGSGPKWGSIFKVEKSVNCLRAAIVKRRRHMENPSYKRQLVLFQVCTHTHTQAQLWLADLSPAGNTTTTGVRWRLQSWAIFLLLQTPTLTPVLDDHPTKPASSQTPLRLNLPYHPPITLRLPAEKPRRARHK